MRTSHAATAAALLAGAHGALLTPPAALKPAVQDLQRMFVVGAVATSLTCNPDAAFAIGPANVPLSVNSYEEVTCPEELRQGRAGGALGAGAGAAGIAQKCVKIKANANNDSGKTLVDAGVFGVVYVQLMACPSSATARRQE